MSPNPNPIPNPNPALQADSLLLGHQESQDSMLVFVSQSCQTLCDPVDYSPPGSSVRGNLQARILEWVATSFSRRSSRPRDRTLVSHIAVRFLPSEPQGKPHIVLDRAKCTGENPQKSKGNKEWDRQGVAAGSLKCFWEKTGEVGLQVEGWGSQAILWGSLPFPSLPHSPTQSSL